MKLNKPHLTESSRSTVRTSVDKQDYLTQSFLTNGRATNVILLGELQGGLEGGIISGFQRRSKILTPKDFW